MAHQGRTVLFVSHNMPAVTRLCQRVILLSDGSVLQDGPAAQVVGTYLKSGLGTTAAREFESPLRDRGRRRSPAFWAVRVRSAEGTVTDVIDIRKPVLVEMEYEVFEAGYVLMPYFIFDNEEGVTAFRSYDVDAEWRRKPRPSGRYVSTVRVPGQPAGRRDDVRDGRDDQHGSRDPPVLRGGRGRLSGRGQPRRRLRARRHRRERRRDRPAAARVEHGAPRGSGRDRDGPGEELRCRA